jgi:hypothetical protein
VDEAVKRALAIVLLGVLAALVPFAVAGADSETPVGRFSSPPRAVAGAPIFVRSITPCPALPAGFEHDYRWVNVYIDQQIDLVNDPVEGTTADLRPDGSWEVTLSAPVDMPEGVTKSYSVHAQCIAYETPYFAPDRDLSITTTTLNPAISYHRYFLRSLTVTGFGPSTVQEGEGPSGTTSTTSVATTTTTSGSSLLSAGLKAVRTTTTSWTSSAKANPTTTVEDPSARWAEIRRELLDQKSSTQALELASTETAAGPTTAPADGGIPWWAFALATMLAVGAVVAFGARKTSALSELDRQASGD